MENRKNEEFLPLVVTQSKIKNAGRGVFTTVNIPKDTVVLSYIGVLCSNFTTDMRSKSIFHLGWIYQMNKPKEFLVDADISHVVA